MFGFLSKIFTPKPPIGTVIYGVNKYEDPRKAVYADFKYVCTVRCRDNGFHDVTVQTDRSNSDVKYRCLCGEIISLMSPPLVTVRMLGGKEFRTIRGTMTRLDTGDFGLHEVKISQVISTNEGKVE